MAISLNFVNWSLDIPPPPRQREDSVTVLPLNVEVQHVKGTTRSSQSVNASKFTEKRQTLPTHFSCRLMSLKLHTFSLIFKETEISLCSRLPIHPKTWSVILLFQCWRLHSLPVPCQRNAKSAEGCSEEYACSTEETQVGLSFIFYRLNCWIDVNNLQNVMNKKCTVQSTLSILKKILDFIYLIFKLNI